MRRTTPALVLLVCACGGASQASEECDLADPEAPTGCEYDAEGIPQQSSGEMARQCRGWPGNYWVVDCVCGGWGQADACDDAPDPASPFYPQDTGSNVFAGCTCDDNRPCWINGYGTGYPGTCEFACFAEAERCYPNSSKAPEARLLGFDFCETASVQECISACRAANTSPSVLGSESDACEADPTDCTSCRPWG